MTTQKAQSNMDKQFDTTATQRLRAALQEVVANVPEVRSAAAIVDYHGQLNQAETLFAVWTGESGEVKEPAELFGTLQQTLRFLEFALARCQQYADRLRQQVAVLSAEEVRRVQESTTPTPDTDRV